MARTRRVTISFACADAFTTAVSPRARLEVIEGSFNVQTNAATMAVAESSPAATGSTLGQNLPVGSFVATGPTVTVGSGWRLDQTFFRNQTAGSNATVVFAGTVRDVEGVIGES